MNRKSIFDILEEKYDFNNEFKKITYLFNRNVVRGDGYGYPIETLVNNVFHTWKARGSCINCADMRKELEIDTIVKLEKNSPEQIILCLEYYANILYLYSNNIVLPLGWEEINTLSLLRNNIDFLIERLHYKKHIYAEKECVLLIPNDPAAVAVAEIAPKDLAFAILKYNHASLKGQVEEKRRLLQSIANEYEDLLNNPLDGFSSYFDTARGLLNNLNIRHNNKDGKNQHALIKNMPKQELEKNYDELYQLLLFCVLIKDNAERKKGADELLKKLRER